MQARPQGARLQMAARREAADRLFKVRGGARKKVTLTREGVQALLAGTEG